MLNCASFNTYQKQYRYDQISERRMLSPDNDSGISVDGGTWNWKPFPGEQVRLKLANMNLSFIVFFDKPVRDQGRIQPKI